MATRKVWVVSAFAVAIIVSFMMVFGLPGRCDYEIEWDNKRGYFYVRECWGFAISAHNTEADAVAAVRFLRANPSRRIRVP